jgi:hypothetical protein
MIRVFILIAPFTNNQYFLSMHALFIPFVMIHWATNQNICALTEIEKFFTEKEGDDTFFGQLFTPIYSNESFIGNILKPIYEIKSKDDEKFFVWTGLLLLWLITIYKLQINDFSYIKNEFIYIKSQFYSSS